MTDNEYGRMVQRIHAGAAYGSGTPAPKSVPSGQAAKGAAIWDDLRKATSAKTGALRSLWGKSYGILDRLGRWAPLRAFGTVSLSISALQLGWNVGGSVMDLLFPGLGDDEATGELPNEYVAKKLIPVSPGDNLCPYAYGGNTSGPCSKGGGGLLAPSAGSVVDWGTLSTAIWPSRKVESGGVCADFYYYQAPAGMEYLSAGATESFCASKPFTLSNGVGFVPLQVAALPPTGTGPNGTRKGATPTPVGDAEAETIIREKVLQNPREDDFSGWWWNHDPEAREETHIENQWVGLDPADPLAVRIPVPKVGEKAEDYAVRLEALGLVPDLQVVAESAIDPRMGPLEVVGTTPKMGSNVAPETVVRVRYNPATAPEATGYPPQVFPSPVEKGSCSASVNAIDLEPLGVPLSERFPFGAFSWFVGTFESWGLSSDPPVWEFPLGDNIDWVIDFGVIDPFIDPVRLAVLIVSALGFVWFLVAAALKIDSGVSSD